jgi:hypothetical protein
VNFGDDLQQLPRAWLEPALSRRRRLTGRFELPADRFGDGIRGRNGDARRQQEEAFR